MYINTSPYSLKGDMLLVLDNNLQYCNMKFNYRRIEEVSQHSEIEFGEIPEDADILNFSLADIKIIPILTQHKNQTEDNNTIIDSNIIDIPKDGYYTLTYLIIPKEEYIKGYRIDGDKPLFTEFKGYNAIRKVVENKENPLKKHIFSILH